jgi:hypothetical protein
VIRSVLVSRPVKDSGGGPAEVLRGDVSESDLSGSGVDYGGDGVVSCWVAPVQASLRSVTACALDLGNFKWHRWAKFVYSVPVQVQVLNLENAREKPVAGRLLGTAQGLADT